MRLSLAVNGEQKARASLTARGWLGAHVNLSNGIESESNDRVSLNAIDTSAEPNTTHSTWGGFPLVPGDKVEIEVLLDGDSDAPHEVSETTENANNLFSDAEQARRLLDSIKSCDTALQEVLERARDVEPEDEFRKVALAVGSVLVEMDRQLISPTLRRHPDLLFAAQDMKLR
jgi:chaperonin cofactor prefoldin